MKKILSLFLALIMMLSLCMVLISCNNADDSDGDDKNENDSGDNNSSDEPFNIDLAGYTANIGNAKAIGISKKASSEVSTVAYGRAKSGALYLFDSTLSSRESTKDKNYIVMSTTKYDANDPETDESGLTSVTFTKITTENATTEITGTKYVTAKKGEISINATNGFTYSLYEGDRLIESKVADNGEPNKPNKKVFIVFDGLTDGVDYKIEYKGIGLETTVTQEDINGEIDKLCVMNGYTFISFVPQGQSERPSDSDLNYDSNGIAAYDKTGYSSGATRQSFVIDNATGYVYQIKDVGIDEIKNNLTVISGKIYDMRVNAENELEFYTVVQNETLVIQDYFKDKYGNKYIKNNVLDVCDEVNQTLYYTEAAYIISRENTVVCIENNGSVNKLGEDFEKTKILPAESYTFNKSLNDRVISHIDGGFLYSYTVEGSFYRTNLLTYVSDTISFGVYGRVPVFDSNLEEWRVPNFESFAINYNIALMYYENDLYYCQIWENELIHAAASFDDIREGCVLLLENAEGSLGVQNVEELLFTKTTVTQTVYYKVIVDENGIPKAVNSETYVAPEQTVITLQPLNK